MSYSSSSLSLKTRRVFLASISKYRSAFGLRTETEQDTIHLREKNDHILKPCNDLHWVIDVILFSAFPSAFRLLTFWSVLLEACKFFNCYNSSIRLMSFLKDISSTPRGAGIFRNLIYKARFQKKNQKNQEYLEFVQSWFVFQLRPI
jgi:hypothetical protein